MADEKENLLLFIPEHAREWEINQESQLVIIKKPKFENEFLKKHILSRMRRPYFRINLDAYGSFVWKNIDGHTTVYEIGSRLKTVFGESIEPVYERLAIFIQTLAQNKCINYQVKNQDK